MCPTIVQKYKVFVSLNYPLINVNTKLIRLAYVIALIKRKTWLVTD